ncbi:WD40-repeat-containing domain protein [Peziza echinospora]|nr:WD40-repeat-containing domain protein [Peziza echinospora]
MAPAYSLQTKPTFEPVKVIQPFYTGGKIALDKDSRLLVTTVEDDVLILDYETGDELARIEGDGEDVTTLALNPQATLLAICSRSQTMRIFSIIYEPSTPTKPASVTTACTRSVKAHSAPVHVAVTDPTGTLLATGGAEGLVKVWDMKGGFVTHNFRGHGGVVSALRFYSPTKSDGKTGPAASGWKLASGADDTKVRVWDLLKKTCVALLESHVSVVRGLDWSEDGRILASGGRDKVVCLWDTKSWKLRNTIPVLEEVEAVGFLASGLLEGYNDEDAQVLYAGGQNNQIRLWNCNSGKEITTAAPESDDNEPHAILDIIYHQNQKTLLSVHVDNTLLIHQLTITPTALPVIRTLSGNLDEVIDAQYVTPTDSIVALATNSEEIRLVNVSGTFGDVAILRGHEDIVICLDRDASGKWLASGGKDNNALLWKIDHEKNQYTCYAKFTGHAESIGAIALPRASSTMTPKFLLTGSQDRTIKKWEIPTAGAKKAPRAAYTRKAHEKDINSIDVSQDDSMFASASQDKTVKIWSVSDGEVLGVLRGHRRGVWSVRFGPSTVNASTLGGAMGGKVVVTGSADKTVRIWSLADYSCLRTFEGHANSVLKTIWIHNGTRVASAGGEGLVKVWDVKTGECLVTLDNHGDRVWVLTQSTITTAAPALSADDDGDDEAEEPHQQLTLLSGSSDATLTFWADTTAKTQLNQIKEEAKQVEEAQRLANYIHVADYRSAIVLALSLNHPGRLLTLFTNVFTQSVGLAPGEENSATRDTESVEKVLRELDDTQLITLLSRIRDWNTNVRTAPVSQRLLGILMKSYPASRFVKLARGRGIGTGLGGVLKAIEAYTEKHYKRMEDLVEESWVVEYTLGEMEEVLAIQETAVDEDVEMLE